MINLSKGARTKQSILEVGLQVWRERPDKVNAKYIASMVDVTHGTVSYHYGSSDGLRDAIAAHAVAVQDDVVVPMLITTSHPAVAHLTAPERLTYLAGV